MCRTPCARDRFARDLAHFGAGSAVAGEYSVANCQADQLNYNTRAFVAFAHRE